MSAKIILIAGLSLLLVGPAGTNAQPNKREKVRDKRKVIREKHRDKRKDVRQERRDKRKEAREERRGDRKEVREERREIRKDAREDRKEAREDRKEIREERRAVRAKRRRDHRKIRTRYRNMRRRAYVSGYTPGAKKVVIRGANFPTGAVVTIGGKPVKAVITPTRIHFDAAASGRIVIKLGDETVHVGNYDAKVAMTRDARKKRRQARRKRAQAAVKGRWKARAKKRAERRERLAERRAQAAKTREERARRRAAAIRAKYKARFLARQAVRTELALHAERQARLLRMQELADLDDNDKLAIRVDLLIELENERHEQRMTTFRDGNEE